MSHDDWTKSGISNDTLYSRCMCFVSIAVTDWQSDKVIPVLFNQHSAIPQYPKVVPLQLELSAMLPRYASRYQTCILLMMVGHITWDWHRNPKK